MGTSWAQVDFRSAESPDLLNVRTHLVKLVKTKTYPQAWDHDDHLMLKHVETSPQAA